MASLNILCSDLLNFLNEVTKKIRKGKHKEIFCGPSKIFRNMSWSITICLKYFIALTKTLRHSPPPLLHTYCPVPKYTDTNRIL